MKKTKKTSVSGSVSGCELTFEMANQKSNFTGDSVVKAMDGIKRVLIRGNGKLTLKKDGKTSELVLYPGQLRRFFLNKTAKALAGEKLENSLK